MTTELDATTTTGRGLSLLALVVRLIAGGLSFQTGLEKLLDFGKVVDSMERGGWRPPELAAFMVTATETLGGLGLVLGLLTPLAAMAVTAAMLDAWAANVRDTAFWTDPVNMPLVIGIGAVVVLFTGAGRYSLDHRLFGRARWPRLVSVALLVIAIIAAVVTWVALNGTNPIHFTAPAG